MSSRRWVVSGALAALILGAAVGSTLAASSAVSFKYRLQPGATYDQVMTMGLTLTMGTGNAKAAPGVPGLDQPIQQKTRIETTSVVGAKDSDGGMSLEVRVGHVEASLVVAGQTIQVPFLSAGSESPVMRARIAPGGRAVDLDLGQTEGLPAGTAERLMSAMPTFPDRPLSVGDSFEIPMDMALPVPVAGGDAKMEGTATYTLESVNGDEARFGIRQRFSAATKDDAGMAFGMQMSGGGVGTGTFDLVEGIFTDIRIDMTLALDLRTGMPAGQAAAPEAAGEAPAPGGVHVEGQGPVEITMRRRVKAP